MSSADAIPLPRPVKFPVIGSLAESVTEPVKSLRSGQYSAPPSGMAIPLQLPGEVLEGEYLNEPGQALTHPRPTSGGGPIVTPEGEPFPETKALPSARGRKVTTVTGASPPNRSIIGSPLYPEKAIPLPNVHSGESAARHYLGSFPLNELMTMAKQRALTSQEMKTTAPLLGNRRVAQ